MEGAGYSPLKACVRPDACERGKYYDVDFTKNLTGQPRTFGEGLRKLCQVRL